MQIMQNTCFQTHLRLILRIKSVKVVIVEKIIKKVDPQSCF